VLRRKRVPPELLPARRGFAAIMENVDRAHAALTEAAPSTRFAGRPLPDALVDFEEALRSAQARMETWRRPELEPEWERCSEALRSSLALAERLRVEAPDIPGFETLIGTIDSLVAPLEAFEDADERFRALRR
jgi:hypothetical protein